MTPALWLQLAMVSVATLLLFLAVAVAARRSYRNVVETRRAQREAMIRPQLLEVLSEDDPDMSKLLAMCGGDAKAMERMAWQFLTKVRGASREILVDLLRERGAIETERKRTHKMGAVGRAKSADHLGAAGDAVNTDDLVRLLQDRKDEVRVVAARALGKLGDARAVFHLLAALEGNDRIPVSIISMSILHVGPSAIGQLVEGLGSDSATIRMVCAQILGMHGAIESAKWLGLLVEHDPVIEVQVQAAYALGRIGMPQSVSPLMRALAPNNQLELRTAATEGLGLIGGVDAMDALHTAVFDSEDRVARAAAKALARLGESGTHRLLIISESEGPAAAYAVQSMAREQVDLDARRRRATVGAE